MKITEYTNTFYVCPHCNKKKFNFIKWETCSVGYNFNLGLLDGGEDIMDIHRGDVENYECPGCKGDLDIPEDMLNMFYE